MATVRAPHGTVAYELLGSARGADRLPLEVEVDADGRAIRLDLGPVELQFHLAHPCPPHASDGLGGFGDGVLRGLRETHRRDADHVDHFLHHGDPPARDGASPTWSLRLSGPQEVQAGASEVP